MIEGGRGRAWLEIQMLPKSRETDRRYKISVCLLTLCHICFLFERGKRFSLLSKNVPWDHHLYFYIFHTVSWHRQNCVTLSMKPSLPIFSRFKMQVKKYLRIYQVMPFELLKKKNQRKKNFFHSPRSWACWHTPPFYFFNCHKRNENVGRLKFDFVVGLLCIVTFYTLLFFPK